jgi:hypothetical protein
MSEKRTSHPPLRYTPETTKTRFKLPVIQTTVVLPVIQTTVVLPVAQAIVVPVVDKKTRQRLFVAAMRLERTQTCPPGQQMFPLNWWSLMSKKYMRKMDRLWRDGSSLE